MNLIDMMMLFIAVWFISIVVASLFAVVKRLNIFAAVFLTVFLGPVGLLLFLYSYSERKLQPSQMVDNDSLTVLKNKAASVRNQLSLLESELNGLQQGIDDLSVKSEAAEGQEECGTKGFEDVPKDSGQDQSSLMAEKCIGKYEGLEVVFGKYWLSRIGIFLFVAGMGFFANQAFVLLNAYGKIAIGYLIAALFFAWGARLEKNDHLKRIGWGVTGGAWGLLYLTTYAMHYIRLTRVIESPVAEFIMLAAISVAAIVYSLHYRQWVVTAMTYVLAFFTAGLGGIDYLAVCYCTVLCASVMYLAHRLNWYKLMLSAVGGIYLIYAYWLRESIYKGFLASAGSGNSSYKFYVGISIIIGAWLVFFIGSLLARKSKDGDEEEKYYFTAIFMNALFAAFLGIREIGFFIERLHIRWDLSFFYLMALMAFYLCAAYIYNMRRMMRFSTLCVALAFFLSALAVLISSANMPVTLFWLVEIILIYMAVVNYKDTAYRIVLAVLSVACLCRLFFIDSFDTGRFDLLGLSMRYNIFIYSCASAVYLTLASLSVRSRGIWNDLEYFFYRYQPLFTVLVFLFVLGNSIVAGWLTLSWAILAFVILGAGLLMPCKKYRIFGLIVISLALVRLLVIDIKNMGTVYRMVTFVLFGAGLVAMSFIYSKFGKGAQ